MKIIWNLIEQVLHLIARFAPIGRFRVNFYRLRGAKIGRVSYIGEGVYLLHQKKNMIIIEDGVSIAPNVTIISHYQPNKEMRKYYPEAEKRVIIKKNSWIGAGAVILKGVTIGESSVVGAGSVVTKDVPPYTVVAGNPIKTIKKLK